MCVQLPQRPSKELDLIKLELHTSLAAMCVLEIKNQLSGKVVSDLNGEQSLPPLVYRVFKINFARALLDLP